jgi:hypothetical protein
MARKLHVQQMKLRPSSKPSCCTKVNRPCADLPRLHPLASNGKRMIVVTKEQTPLALLNRFGLLRRWYWRLPTYL